MTDDVLKIEEMSWWRRRPRTEKCLVGAIGVLVLLVVIASSVNLTGPSDCRDLCLTSHCVKAAARVIEKIDPTVDPCDDFYGFACGNFLKSTVIPEDMAAVSTNTMIRETVYELMHSSIKAISDKDIKPFRLLKDLYESCMNTEAIERDSMKHIAEIFDSTGGWPILEGPSWNESAFDWIATSHRLLQKGFSVSMLITMEVLVEDVDSTKYSLCLNQVGLTFDKIMRRGFGDAHFDAYYDYMVQVARVLGVEESTAKAEMKEVAELVISIARITLPDEERRDLTKESNPMTVRELEGNFTYVPWLKYINGKLEPYKKLHYSDMVIVKVPSYYNHLGNIMTNTSRRTLANYIYWMAMEGSIAYLTDELRDLELEYFKSAFGVQERPARWKECTEGALSLYVASGSLYIRNFFKKQSKQAVVEMVGYIKDQFVKTLKTVEWMDPVTRQHAIDKANAIYLHLGYPDELLDDQKLEDYYKHLNFDVSNFLGSRLNLSLLKNRLEYPQIYQKFDKKNWMNHAYVVLITAYYDLSENSIEFLASLLQDVYFDVDNPKYMNYGAVGHVIGHEITHGFDDKGRQHDKNGNLAEWWQPATKAAFDRKVRCIVDQYGNVTVPEIGENLNGVNTQGENVADNAGIKLARLAYEEWVGEHGRERALPGLQYTPEQMFWIAAANVWCQVERDRQLKVTVENDQHVPNAYRVNVPLMNSKEFARDFKCAANSKMNPRRKCRVW